MQARSLNWGTWWKSLFLESAKVGVYPSGEERGTQQQGQERVLTGSFLRTGCSSIYGYRQRGLWEMEAELTPVSNPSPFPYYFTAWYERRIFDKTRQNRQGKKKNLLFLAFTLWLPIEARENAELGLNFPVGRNNLSSEQQQSTTVKQSKSTDLKAFLS